MALPSRNVGKYELWTDEDVLPDKPLPWKKTTISKRFEYSQLSSGLRKQTGFAKDQYKFFKDQCHYQH